MLYDNIWRLNRPLICHLFPFYDVLDLSLKIVGHHFVYTLFFTSRGLKIVIVIMSVENHVQIQSRAVLLCANKARIVSIFNHVKQ